MSQISANVIYIKREVAAYNNNIESLLEMHVWSCNTYNMIH